MGFFAGRSYLAVALLGMVPYPWLVMVVLRANPWGAQAYQLSIPLSRQQSGMGVFLLSVFHLWNKYAEVCL